MKSMPAASGPAHMHRILDNVQDVQRGAERSRKLPAVVECRLGCVAEISCDEDVGDFDHMSTFIQAMSTRRAKAARTVRVIGRIEQRGFSARLGDLSHWLEHAMCQ